MVVLPEGCSILVVQSRLLRSVRKGHTGNSPQCSATFPNLLQSHMIFLYLTACNAALVHNFSSHSLNLTPQHLAAQLSVVCKLCEEQSPLGSLRVLKSLPLVGEASQTLLKSAISLVAEIQTLHSLRKKQL